MSEIKIAVVIPVLSAFQECIVALSQIKTKCIWTPFIAPQWEENKAIAAVWNAQAQKAFGMKFNMALILNDDAFVEPHTVDNLVREIYKGDALLVSGTEINPHPTAISEPMAKANLNFSCFMISDRIFEAVGYFDENFYPAYFEDNDFHYRMQLLGLPAYGITNAPFFHKGSTTQRERIRKLGEEPHEQFRACREYYKQKWGGLPGDERYTHPYNDGKLSARDWKWKKDDKGVGVE